ncbi:hypothetical protein H2248_001944 [Termitomyces sp. 'cryptogamus']|nr:hypothetical protein H2248_001944 [Termitomyces sp. 'cryptogamus']
MNRLRTEMDKASANQSGRRSIILRQFPGRPNPSRGFYTQGQRSRSGSKWDRRLDTSQSQRKSPLWRKEGMKGAEKGGGPNLDAYYVGFGDPKESLWVVDIEYSTCTNGGVEVNIFAALSAFLALLW